MSTPNPTLTPSPQGGGKLDRCVDELAPLNWQSSPSPLWGGIKGGGVSPQPLELVAP